MKPFIISFITLHFIQLKINELLSCGAGDIKIMLQPAFTMSLGGRVGSEHGFQAEPVPETTAGLLQGPPVLRVCSIHTLTFIISVLCMSLFFRLQQSAKI